MHLCLFRCNLMGSSWLLPASDRLLSRCFPRAVFLYLLHLCSASVNVYPLGPIWAPGPTRPLCSQSFYTQEPLGLLALPQGIAPKNPSALQTTEQQLCTRELARGEERGELLSGNRSENMLHLTCELLLTAPPVGPPLLLQTGPSCNPCWGSSLGPWPC